jgi:hypothetical protein
VNCGTHGRIGLRECLFGPRNVAFPSRRFARSVLRRAFVLLACGLLVADTPVSRQTEFRVWNPDFEMTVTIEFYDDLHEEPRFYSRSQDNKQSCITVQGQPCGSGSHMNNWTGSYAIVHFRLLRQSADVAPGKLRERVRVIDQDEGLPDRPPFETEIAFTDHVGSDIELYGYFQKSSHTAATASDHSWRILRQELIYGTDSRPFMILHWRHTVENIRLIDAIPVGATRLETSKNR